MEQGQVFAAVPYGLEGAGGVLHAEPAGAGGQGRAGAGAHLLPAAVAVGPSHDAEEGKQAHE